MFESVEVDRDAPTWHPDCEDWEWVKASNSEESEYFLSLARAALAVSEEGGEEARLKAKINEAIALHDWLAVEIEQAGWDEPHKKSYADLDAEVEQIRRHKLAARTLRDVLATPSGEGQGEARADDLVGRIRVEITQCDKWARHHRNEAAETSVDLAYAREAVAVAEAFEDVAKRLRSALAAQSSEGEER